MKGLTPLLVVLLIASASGKAALFERRGSHGRCRSGACRARKKREERVEKAMKVQRSNSFSALMDNNRLDTSDPTQAETGMTEKAATSFFFAEVEEACERKEAQRSGTAESSTSQAELPSETKAAYARVYEGVSQVIDAVHFRLQQLAASYGVNEDSGDQIAKLQGACFRTKSLGSAGRKFRSSVSRLPKDSPLLEPLEPIGGNDATNKAYLRESFCASDIGRFTIVIAVERYTELVEQVRNGPAIKLGMPCRTTEGLKSSTDIDSCHDVDAPEVPVTCDVDEPAERTVSLRPFKQKNYWKKGSAELPDGEPLPEYVGINDVGFIEVPIEPFFSLSPAEVAYLETVSCEKPQPPPAPRDAEKVIGIAADGTKFVRLRLELQFHTEADLDVKENEAHLFYELYRLMPKTSPLNAALMKKAVHQLMGQAYDRVPRPEGAAWGIKGGKKGTKSKVINGKVDLSNAEGGLNHRKQHPVPLDPTDEDQLQHLLDQLSEEAETASSSDKSKALRKVARLLSQAEEEALGLQESTAQQVESFVEVFTQDDHLAEKICDAVKEGEGGQHRQLLVRISRAVQQISEMTKAYTDKLNIMVNRLETKALRLAKKEGKKRNRTPEQRAAANKRRNQLKKLKRQKSMSTEPEDESEWQTVG